METGSISLKAMQEIKNIGLEPADNGGCILRFTIYTPSVKHSDSNWDDHIEIFPPEEIEDALDRIRELYKASFATRRKPQINLTEKAIKD